jgi:4-hydroxy-tetrahydrodipicolinate synthase
MPLKPGSTVALITPFLPDTGAVDVPGLRALVEYHLNAGTDNLCILGTTGEASVLSMSERALVLQTVAEVAKGRVPLLVGCGTIDPQHVHEMTQQAFDCGADAALVVTPYYVKPPQRGLIRHFTDVATTSPLPVVMYNVPGRTAVDMADSSIAIAAMHENIVAVKDATGNLARVAALRQQLRDHQVSNDFLLLSGDDATSVDFCLLGGHGCISVTANVAARAMHESMVAALQGDRTVATTLNEPLTALHTKLFCESNPMPVKYAARRLGLIGSSYCRPPLDCLAANCEGIVDDALRQAGLLPDAATAQQ